MIALVVIAIIVGILWFGVKQNSELMEKEHEVAHEAISNHVASFIRERTGSGPWFEMDEYYRQTVVDLKCEQCDRDTIFVCNNNPARETEFVDVHYSKSKLMIKYGNRVLFYGNPINLMSYPQEQYRLTKDNPPPKETGAYAAWEEYFKGNLT